MCVIAGKRCANNTYGVDVDVDIYELVVLVRLLVLDQLCPLLLFVENIRSLVKTVATMSNEALVMEPKW